VTILWNQGVYGDKEVNRPDIIINNKKEKICILIDVAIPADRNVMQKEAGNKKTKIQMFMYTDIMNVQHEMYDYINYNWNHQKSKKRFKEN
jgi:hypothetical protein